VTANLPHDMLLSDGPEAEHPDPHVWMDPQLWKRCVSEVERQMCALDPEHADDYRNNSMDYQRKLDALDAYARESIASIPVTRRVFVTSHDAFQYFGRAYDIQVMGIQGLSTESEAGLRRVNELVTFLWQRQVPTVFFESSVPKRSIEALAAGVAARGHRLAMKGPMFSDAMGSAGTYEGTYLGMIDHNVTLLTRGLGGTAPERGWQGKLSLMTSEHDSGTE
jgi:manganese/zinc/iron transport system substrate-binding protein